MRPFGSDLIRAGHGEQWILFARRSKGWLPRVPKTLTSAEHPGTAVLWEDRFFEVVTADAAPGGAIRYMLEPWSDHHVIRVSEPYDEASEEHRASEHHSAVKREKGRKAANLAGIFTGLLPAIAQEQLGNEIGIQPAKLTSLSILIPFAYLIWFANEFVRRTFVRESIPLPLFLLAVYLLIESAFRLNIAWFHRRPVGSVLGFFPYLLFYLFAGKRSGAVSPFAVPKGQRLFITQPTEDVALRDAYTMREPLLTLLSVEEQKALEQRFGFKYRKPAFIVAWFLLAMSAAGVVTALASLQYGPRISAILSLVVALAIGGEQVFRLQALRRGPAPSMLAFVVRPFTRKLLSS
jgi:hypothetical protein